PRMVWFIAFLRSRSLPRLLWRGVPANRPPLSPIHDQDCTRSRLRTHRRRSVAPPIYADRHSPALLLWEGIPTLEYRNDLIETYRTCVKEFDPRSAELIGEAPTDRSRTAPS